MSATLTSTDPVLAAFAEEVGESGPVAIAGNRTRWDIGGPSADGTRVLCAPTGIVDYSPDEMTVTVRAGTTVAELHTELAAKGQRSALPSRGGTVGGALAVGENDIRALGRSMIRTSLLQIRYVSAEGRIIGSGGPTVKNVSGFDLPRLMVGSLGTLGLFVEAIIRTNPIPAVSRWLRSERCEPLAVHDALLAPGAVLWDGTTTWVQLEGHKADVDAQHRALAAVGTFTEVQTSAGDSKISGLDDLPVDLPANRWSLAPSDLLDLPAALSEDGSCRFVAAIGLGLAFVDRPQQLRALEPEVDVLAKRVKENFDPTARLNPGRNPGHK